MSNTTTIESAGYIVHDNNETIHGYGRTVDAAWADMLHTMKQAEIALLSDEDDSTEQHGSWTRESGFKVRAASAALLQAVEDMGGDLSWRNIGGVAVTRDEAETA